VLHPAFVTADGEGKLHATTMTGGWDRDQASAVGAGGHLLHGRGGAAPAARHVLDDLREHLLGLDGEVAGQRVVVEGPAPAGGGDVEAGEVAAGSAAVPRGPHDEVTVTSSCMIEATCTVCRRREVRLLHVVDGWRIVRCTSCGHRYVSPRPSMEEVQ